MCETCGCGEAEGRRVSLERDLLEANHRIAAHNREHLAERGVLALNLVSSPGAGKTSLLVETIRALRGRLPMVVIEGDQRTSLDAERIAETGVAAYQVNTGRGCHLEASAIHDALHHLAIPRGGVLFIENVGNLVCPALFDLGEAHKVVVLSVPEGDDKPAKYPHMFAAADLMLVNKIDLLPYVDFRLDRCLEEARRTNPDIEAICLSARTGEGLEGWLEWLEARRPESPTTAGGAGATKTRSLGTECRSREAASWDGLQEKG